MNDTIRHDPSGKGVWIGDECFPWAVQIRNDFETSDYVRRLDTFVYWTRRFRGALIPFENGLSLSIIWHNGTYSSNRECFADCMGNPPPFTDEPTEVEIGVYGPDDKLLQLRGDTVEGWVTAPMLLRLIPFLASLPSSTRELSNLPALEA